MGDKGKDVNIGDDGLLTKELTIEDRVTLTRAATGQQIATMTVADFMQKCAEIMPVASPGHPGLMSPPMAEQLLDTRTYSRREVYIALWRSNQKARIHIGHPMPPNTGLNSFFVRVTWVNGAYNNLRPGVTVKSTAFATNDLGHVSILPAVIERVSNGNNVYISDLMIVPEDGTYARDIFFDVVYKSGGPWGDAQGRMYVETFVANEESSLDALQPWPALTVEYLDLTPEDQGRDNRDESIASLDRDGLMSAADRLSYPADNMRYNFVTEIVIPHGKKAQISFDIGTYMNHTIMLHGGWWDANGWGVVNKIGHVGVTIATSLTANMFYISDVINYNNLHCIDIINKRGATQSAIIDLNVYTRRPDLNLRPNFTVEYLDATDAERAMDNRNELV